MTQETEAQPADLARTSDGPREVLATLKPQVYGKDAPNRILDPVVEPQWVGVRALAAIDGDGAALVDTNGEPIPGMEPIVEALGAASLATGLIIDGWISKQTSHVESPVVWPDEMPSMGRLIGLRRNRAVDTLELKEASLESLSFDDDEISFVATDLLWLEGTSLLDIPLLERRRLLDAVIAESEGVRLGAFIRPPIERWTRSWRSQGFTGLTYKAANSRYLPGEVNRDWTTGGMPRR